MLGPHTIDIVGNRYGRLVVLSFDHRCGTKTYWNTVCDCGTLSSKEGSALKNGQSKSCGCLRTENRNNLQHGRYGTREYRIWTGMWSRCRNPKNKDWKNYGGRGIQVCSEWEDFKVFFSDMGIAPPGLTLDRENNNGNYCKGNCRWATAKEQMNNRRLRHPVPNNLSEYSHLSTRGVSLEFGVSWQTAAKWRSAI